MNIESNPPESASDTLNDEVREASADMRARAAELGRRAGQKADELRAATADRLDGAAQAVHNKADALASGADYVRDHDVREMMGDLLDVVRNHPGPALVGAATLGFLVGRALSRD